MNRAKYHYYTQEEKQFFREFSFGHTREETRQEFIKRFGWEITSYQCIRQIKEAGGTGRTGRFEAGNEHICTFVEEEGTEKLHKLNDGRYEWKIKVNGEWKRKNRYIWQKAYGEIPEGKRLLYKDGNSENCTLENLILVDAPVATEMMRSGYYSTRGELHESCIVASMLTTKIREKENRKNDKKRFQND